MSAPAQATTSDRALSAFRRLVSSVFPGFVYALVHEYSVAESDGLTFSGTPTDPTFSPQLPTGVPYSPSLAGSFCIVPVGTLAYVGFANADPAKPYLVRFGAATLTAPGRPTSVTVDAQAQTVNGVTVPGVVTVGPNADTVQVGTTFAATALTAPGHLVRYGDNVTIGTATGVLTLTAPAPVSTGKS